ncbi:hypothetical protein [Riemerella anatipestifer]|uniref:Uncharacterized protein n=1 Tax=Riemerella anatipestifer TaxID=34085 RepID=A0A1S7DV04_RIEAN|nr:hypothetical protein [Riemerella anatipestifer]AQY22962.1 hypothetical protein AB406_2022 [Riemerella anatipestifer]MBT0550399.1 hypothetical protein [Riemerella anatipestifer]MBT0556859.1 hypothetical protein [Riemerella anatipestifer]MBT0561151.1 hypothetical protein [Riemerella anatipestifer]MCO7355782.1 hypothetical protein [Riemerella anatipestifer]
MKKFIINLLLFLIAPILELLLMPINVIVVFVKDWRKKGFKSALIGISNYFKESAIRKDIYLCSEYRTLWNCTLKTKEGAKIGVNKRTLSADLGQQDHEATMSRTGAILNLILFLIERNHSRKAYGK